MLLLLIKKRFSERIIKLEEALFTYIGELELRILKTGFSDNKWKYITNNLAYPYEIFNTLDDYQKLVDNLKKEDFISKLKPD